MSRTRLYTEGPLHAGNDFELGGDQARYVGRVLRLRPEDELILFDGLGGEYPAIIRSLSKNGVMLSITGHIDHEVESPLAIHLLQSISRGDRMDFVVQKSTELGVRQITPLITEYSVVKLDKPRAEKRVRHWRGIAASACEQSGRNILPVIEPPVSLRDWLDAHHGDSTSRLVLHPGAGHSIKSADVSSGSVAVLIGPEGGLSSAEHELAETTGFRAVGFGPRVLRTETAALAVLAALQTLHGDLA